MGTINLIKKRILYIEDYPNNMLMIRRIMQAEGHELLEAVDGESGWEMITRERPDCILMDLSLPGIDGLALTRIIRADPDLKSIPIIVLTAHGDSQIKNLAHEAGCDLFWHKPVQVQQVREAINRL